MSSFTPYAMASLCLGGVCILFDGVLQVALFICIIYIGKCGCVCACVRVCVCVCVRVCTYIPIYIFMYTYIYIHTCTFTQYALLYMYTASTHTYTLKNLCTLAVALLAVSWLCVAHRFTCLLVAITCCSTMMPAMKCCSTMINNDAYLAAFVLSCLHATLPYAGNREPVCMQQRFCHEISGVLFKGSSTCLPGSIRSLHTSSLHTSFAACILA
jgi:hypothetical protein